jgi:hypothetical protein
MTRQAKSLAQALVDLRADVAALRRYEQEGQEDWLIDAEEDLRSSAAAVLAAIDAGDRVIDGHPSGPDAGATSTGQVDLAA